MSKPHQGHGDVTRLDGRTTQSWFPLRADIAEDGSAAVLVLAVVRLPA